MFTSSRQVRWAAPLDQGFDLDATTAIPVRVWTAETVVAVEGRPRPIVSKQVSFGADGGPRDDDP